MTMLLRCDHVGCSNELAINPTVPPAYISVGPNHYCCAAHAFPNLVMPAEESSANH